MPHGDREVGPGPRLRPGLNAWLPLFAGALLARLDVVELAEPFDRLETTTGLAIVGALMAADLVGDKVPAIDHLLHGIGGVVAPASGAVLFTGQTGIETDIPTALAIVAGAITAGSVHAERAVARSGSTFGTAGTANPVVSLAEDVASASLVALAFLAPVVAFAAVLALLVAGFLVARRVRGALASRR